MILAQKAIIKKDGKILVLKRADDKPVCPGVWDLPGGKWEEGEDVIASIVREVREETGFIIEPDPRPVCTIVTEINPGKPVEFRIYTIRTVSGTFRMSNEHSDARWVAPLEINDLRAMPYVPQLLKHGF
jgi:8-oxo-dGTP diphosphatase